MLGLQVCLGDRRLRMMVMRMGDGGGFVARGMDR